MGEYVYKTKPTATAEVTFESLDGKRTRAEVQVYEYAFKSAGWHEDKQLWARICGPSERAFERRGSLPLRWGIYAFEGKAHIGDPVFYTGSIVAGLEIADGNKIGRIVAVHRGVKLAQPFTRLSA